MNMSEAKHKRYNILDLYVEYPKKFGRFIMALKNLINSDDWGRICGIHGNTFNPIDSGVKCPTNPEEVTQIGETGEPFYCKHSVYSFIAWHAPYIYQFELLLNKHDKSKKREYITLPWLDLTNFNNDYSFINDPEITIYYDSQMITTENPLSSAYYYVNGVRTRTQRNGFLTPHNNKQYVQLNIVKKQLNDALYASNYEEFSSAANQKVTQTPLETPHNSLHDIIGGKNGNMSSIDISAFDPLFWLHHCNMDRHYYSWYSNITNQFTVPLYPTYITEQTMNEHCAPFFDKDIFNINWMEYQYGWQNCTGNYAKVSDIIDIQKFPYTYDIITPYEKSVSNAYISINNVPIPPESVEINVYIHPKDTEFDSNIHFVGSSFWFGINQKKIKCSRCQTAKTNFNIDISDFTFRTQISQVNINEYTIVIEVVGQHSTNNKYNKTDFLKSGNTSIYFQDSSSEIQMESSWLFL
jgi:hypothetical protein